ncbi:serine hydrolase [Pseudonocardia nematodicida]|uniref:Serine hydrolase n=1 Tax=Pseudonocardia nematodicida TaxID=1206997 RepID=A0ABV1K9X6_9PSEU
MTTAGGFRRRRRAAVLGLVVASMLILAPGSAWAGVVGPAGSPGSVVARAPGIPSGWTGTADRAPAAGCPAQAQPPPPPAQEEIVPVAPLPQPDPPVGDVGVCAEEHTGPVPPPPVGVASYVVADLDSGAVLAARAPHARHRPASTIKLLLALVVDDRLPGDRVVVGTPEDGMVDGSRAGIGPGGEYTVDQLLHGLLLASGNDAAQALARELGGVPETVTAMQATARDLGALDTRPATPSGLDGPGGSSSAYDLALILRAALDRPRIATILTTGSIPFPGYAGRPGFELGNGNRLLGTPGFLGGKTGFTDAARHTVVDAAERDGRRLVVALVRGEQEPVRMTDQTLALLNWGAGAPAGGLGTLVDPAAALPGDAAPPGDPGADARGSGGTADPGGAPGADDTRPDGRAPGAGDASGGPGTPGTTGAIAAGGVAASVGILAGLLAVLRRRPR